MKTARVFKSGNSQAVRLPKEFKLAVAEVHVFRKDGDLVLRPLQKTWQDYFDRGRRFSGDFQDTIDNSEDDVMVVEVSTDSIDFA
jgi:antitoxin VapB